ncbi:MAG: T9SS type A sorting domain-containing protein [Flavobacteriaceae bacterium]|nr:T9SS type A sorting domain-containing protein [Flavobacteriaceae bacterium]
MKTKILFAFVALLFSSGMMAQESFSPVEIIQGTFVGTTIPLRDFPVVAEYSTDDVKTMTIFPNRSRFNAKVNGDALPFNDINTKIQSSIGGIQTYALEQNFTGFDNTGATPPDPTGAVGPNHYVHAVNSQIKIFDKTGNVIAGPVSLGSFLSMGTNAGDPIVLYDQLADRYFVSQFGSVSNGLAIGISVTNDPTGAYNVYQFSLDAFPDYPHYAVWPDAYYLTANKGGSNKVYAIDKNVMIAGGANPQIIGFPLPGNTQNPNTVLSPEPANLLGTSFPADIPGYIIYLQDDGWAGVTFDHLKVWEIDVDFVVPGNSTISSPLEIPTDPFNSVFAPFGTGDVEQPGTGQKIDMIGGIVSFAANYRSFGTHNSWVITFNDDIDGADTSGIRWIELRNDDVNPWTVFQEGTYAPADGLSRFMGSAAMDAAGNIGLGFNIASPTLPVGIRYTGRFDGDPLGQMTVVETTIVDGVGVQTFSNRFGDYSHLTMDPDNFTFWHTAEYFTATNQWRTQVASFTLSGGFANDVGISGISSPNNGILTNAETVTVSIRNFGLDPQSNIPVELRVDGSLVASEVFNGTVATNGVENYTFAQTVDLSTLGQTYSIEIKTNLSGDEFSPNDTFIKEVTYLFSNDVGALEITAPSSGSGLGMETIAVTIKNYGASTQSNFDLQYVIDGGSPVVETFVGPIASEEEVSFSFTEQADFSTLGNYNLTVSTTLSGDQDNSNNEVIVVVTNMLCQPSGDCSLGDGFQLFSIAEINNPSGCEGYGDFSNLIANLAPGSTNSLTVTTGWGNQHVNVWIDFNDDFTFTTNELVVNDYIIASGQGAGSYTETFDLVIPANATIGEHIMRAKTNWNAPVPADACEETTFGETEDYTANIGVLGVNDFVINNSNLIITSIDNNNFEVIFNSEFDGTVYMAIYNMLGQQLGVKLVENNGGSYRMNIDLSNVESGVYLIRVGGKNTTTFKTGRVIVK